MPSPGLESLSRSGRVGPRWRRPCALGSRVEPPRYNLPAVVLGVAGAVAAVTIAIKLASDQISLSAFRKAK